MPKTKNTVTFSTSGANGKSVTIDADDAVRVLNRAAAAMRAGHPGTGDIDQEGGGYWKGALITDARGAIQEILDNAEKTREGGEAAHTSKEVKTTLKDCVPPHCDADELLVVLADGDTDAFPDLDVRAHMARILDLEEFSHLGDGSLIRLLWMRDTPVKDDRAVLGKAKPTSAKTRALWPAGAVAAPWWDVTLSLAAWLVMSERDRLRLLHHELGHCGISVDAKGKTSPCSTPHDIEENLNTMARFGIRSADHAKVIAAATVHPGYVAASLSYFVDPTGQAKLFPNPIGQDVTG